MDRVFAPEDAARELDGPIGDDFVGVHVGLSAAAGLPDDEREVVVEKARDDLVGGADDELGGSPVELAELGVGDGRGLLDDAQGGDELAGHLFAADLEVGERPRGLRAPVSIGRDSDFTHGVGLDSLRHGHSPDECNAETPPEVPGGGGLAIAANPDGTHGARGIAVNWRLQCRGWVKSSSNAGFSR